MAWGYEKSFTIEHDDSVRKRINCKDCVNYDKEDKSCLRRPFYLPVDGYDLWKMCILFDLSFDVNNYDEKKQQLIEINHCKKTEKMTNNQTERYQMKNGAILVITSEKVHGESLRPKWIDIKEAQGKKRKILLREDIKNGVLYLNRDGYKPEWINKVKHILLER